MSDILQELSTDNLTRAIEENMLFQISALRKWPRAEVHDDGEIKWSITDIPFPLFNIVLGAQLIPERVDPAIQSILSQARSRNVPLLWMTGPSTQPANLGAHLEKHDFARVGLAPGMALDLTKLSEIQPPPAGFSVQVVEDKETFKQWWQVCAAGFEMPDFVAEAGYDLANYMVSDTMRAYLGWLNGRPVATSFLALSAGVAGIYNVTTLPEAQRQGIGALMTALPLRDARAMGYRAGILHATEMGEGVYRSLGFQEYCRIGQYLYLPENNPGA